MSQGPSIQGQIVINTRSVDQAVASVRKLESNVSKSFGMGTKSASNFAKSLDGHAKAFTRVANENQKYQNIIAKAANTVAGYEAAVRKSNATDTKKESLIKQATASLRGYESAVRAGATGGQALNNINTALSTGLGQLKRDLTQASAAEREKASAAKALEQAQIRTDKAISQSTIQYNKATAAVKQSSMSTLEQQPILNRLDAEYRKLNATLSSNSTSTRAAATAQNRFKETLASVNGEAKKTNMAKSAADAKNYSAEMRNLSTSVVVALGPLSGIASRLTALTTLFNRNAMSIAVVLSSITALAVTFTKAAQYAEEAEKQMFRVNAQLEVMGSNAQVTGEEINDMAHRIAAGTLLSAQEVRNSAGALLEFGGIGRSQFDSVIKAAQGMSVVFGGNLKGNIRKLGRAIEDPVEGLQRLETAGVVISDSMQKQIKELAELGRTYEATNLLLSATESLQKAAAAEAKGLAGAYDTVSGNLDVLYEKLFLSSGAADAMTGSILGVADAVASVADSDQAAVIGASFKAMASGAGSAMKFLVNNLNLLIGGLTFLAGTVLPKATVALVSMSLKGLLALKAGALQAAVQLKGLALATDRATWSARAFSTALLANPIFAVAAGVAALAAAMWGYNSALDSTRASGDSLHSELIKQVEDQIKLNHELTKTQVDGMKERLELEAANLRATSNTYELRKAEEEKLRSEIMKTLAVSSGTREGMSQNAILAKRLKSLEGLRSLAEGLTGAEKAQVEELIKVVALTNEREGALEEVKARLLELKKIIEGTKPDKEVNADLERQLKTVDELRKAYLKEDEEVISLNADLKKTTGIIKQLKSQQVSGVTPTVYYEIADAIETAEKAAREIRKKLLEVGKEDLSKEFIKMRDQIAEAYYEADALQKAIGADDAEVAMIKLNQEIRKIGDSAREAFKEMSPDELARMGEFLPGVTEASGIDAITLAYIELIEAKKLDSLQAQREIDAHKTLRSFRDEQKTQMDGLISKYGELQRASILTSAEGMPDTGIAEWFKKEQEKLSQAASDLAGQSFLGSPEEIDAQLEARREQMRQYFSGTEEDYKAHIEKMEAEAKKQKMFSSIASGAEGAADIVGQSMELMETSNKKNTASYKRMAKAQAIIATGLALTKIWADNPSPYYAIPMTALVSATLGAQMAQIDSANYASGGYVTGPGTGTSDSIQANLSNGEYVMKAEAVRKIGLQQLNMLNNGQVSNFSGGGGVGVMPTSTVSTGGGSEGVSITIVDNSRGEKSYRTEEGFDQNGNREMRLVIDNAVKDSINRGRYDNEMGNSFGVRRKGRKVS